MCNLYSVGPSPHSDQNKWERSLAPVIDRVPGWRIYPGRPGIVVREIEGEPQASIMNWGFLRPEFTKNPINNARDDKLAGRVWSKAFRERRCVIPARWFVEWRARPDHSCGKQPLGIWSDPKKWMWMAGLWEEKDGELHYAMVTTSSNPEIAKFHDRMPAILASDDIGLWLERGGAALIRPYPGDLEIVPMESPQDRPDDPPPPPLPVQEPLRF